MHLHWIYVLKGLLGASFTLRALGGCGSEPCVAGLIQEASRTLLYPAADSFTPYREGDLGWGVTTSELSFRRRYRYLCFCSRQQIWSITP